MKKKAVMTLDRLLSRYGLTSRAQACDWIRDGRVKVNGRVIRNPDTWTHVGEDAVHFDGKRIKRARRVYLVLYKPKGVITSHGDPAERATVYSLLGPRLPWVTPVGRLDKDSSGLLLMTNDTDFADQVTSPASGVTKTYQVKVNGIIPDDAIAALASGIRMKRGDWARPDAVRRIEDRGKYSRLEVVLREGKNREVRRMLEAVGFTVLKLVRTAIGPLTMEGLPIGKWRSLSATEVAALRRCAGKKSTS